MIEKRIFVYISAITLVLIVFYSVYTPKSGNLTNDALDIAEWKSQKNESFLHDAESPLTEEQKKSFKGLNYFPEDPDFRVIAELEPDRSNKIITLQVTNGSKRAYRNFGTARFELHDTVCEVLVLQPNDIQDEDYLFVPFYDETSALSTYGGGRYVEPELLENGRLLIDFNMAYNPYCAYNKKYRCPVPPLENRLKVAVQAGEKNFDF